MLNAESFRFEKVVKSVIETEVKSQHIIRYFPEVVMSNGHNGLSKLAKDAGIDPAKLKPGEYLMFVNKSQTALKMYTPGNVVAHLKMPGTQKLNPRTITMLPRFFNGKEINYNGALREAFRKYYATKSGTHI